MGGYEGSNKKVTRLRTFLEVSTKLENINSLLFSVLLLRIHLETISEREERRPLFYYRSYNNSMIASLQFVIQNV